MVFWNFLWKVGDQRGFWKGVGYWMGWGLGMGMGEIWVHFPGLDVRAYFETRSAE